MKMVVVIVAGGSGTRMGHELPKQFLSLAGKPILIHTIKAFRAALPEALIRVVLPASYMDLARDVIHEHGLNYQLELVQGGETRFHSVKNGIQECLDASLILVHDAVRCLVTSQLIQRCIEHALKNGSAIPVVAVRDSMRKMSLNNHSEVVPREGLFIVQTPQVFPSVPLINAFNKAYSPAFTDEASVMEASGHSVSLVEGEQRNIKITFPEDLVIANCLVNDLS